MTTPHKKAKKTSSAKQKTKEQSSSVTTPLNKSTNKPLADKDDAIDSALTNQILTQALSRFKDDYLKNKKLQFKEITNLSSIVEEYMSCFALIGFSLQDERVVVFNVPSPKDEAALVDLLRSTFVDIISNRP